MRESGLLPSLSRHCLQRFRISHFKEHTMDDMSRPLAVVTGASTGIGLEFARLCAQKDFDLSIAADDPRIEEAARELSETGIECVPVQCDLSTPEGVQEVV